MTSQQVERPSEDPPFFFGSFAPTFDYIVDAAQRSILFWDILRQRGNQYCEHLKEQAPHVLDYEVEVVLDGRTFERPVNYFLVKVTPPRDVEIDSERRPFVVVDPRAGHGPGIGGFKADSEVGAAFNAGHPCYFLGFLPDPMPEQTIGDIARAEAIFLEKVIALHPKADGKPCVIGNCQAGWAIMILAALRPELFGPIIIAGSPLSYWAGVHGKNPMRYSGGLLGGSWLTAFTSDLGDGKFDGAWLVQNFERQNPANTIWTKQYNLYSKIDTEAERYLGFERWWGGHVILNAEEIQFIVDELFIGNNLANGKIQTSDGTVVDLRNVHSPIVVFCSRGDNVTPPQQALGWIADIYADVDEIRSYGQTIVYTIHDSIGHLGIFVSGGVAKKQHQEFSSNIDLIDILPPGLYEAVFEANSEDKAHGDLASGKWVMRCETRTLDDIRALGGNDDADERRFATALRVSEVNLALYRAFVQPAVRAASTAPFAEWMRRMHPLRLQYEIFSDANPVMATASVLAEQVRQSRRPVGSSNAFVKVQEDVSRHIVAALDGWRQFSEVWAERLFMNIYGSPILQAVAGVGPADNQSVRKMPKSKLHEDLLQKKKEELLSRISAGGLPAAMTRALLFAGKARAAIDERSFEMVRRIRQEYSDTPLAEFKSLVREQFSILLEDSDKALAVIPSMLPDDMAVRTKAFDLIKTVLSARGDLSGQDRSNLARVAGLFGLDNVDGTISLPLRTVRTDRQSAAS